MLTYRTGAAGVPTVATSVGGIPEVIDDERTGYLVAAGDASALANRVVELLDNEQLRMKMGQAMRDRVRSDFSFASMGRSYDELFRKLVRS